jgi:hypothetical protein
MRRGIQRRDSCGRKGGIKVEFTPLPHPSILVVVARRTVWSEAPVVVSGFVGLAAPTAASHRECVCDPEYQMKPPRRESLLKVPKEAS